MKTANSIIGAFITFFLLLGIMFKIMHWPGAGPIIVLSTGLLSLYVFLVAGANISSYKGRGFLQACNGIGGFGASILAIGLLFKIMHWPGSGPMMIFGMFFLIIIIALFMILYLSNKEPINLSAGTFYATVCFGLLTYGVSVGGSSKSFLENVIINANNIENNSKLLYNQNTKLIANIDDTKTAEIHKETSKLIEHINDLKSELYAHTDGLPKEIADTITIAYINGKDNYDIPTHLMGLADPANPTKVKGMEIYSAVTLREKIEEFNSVIEEIDPNIEVINIDYVGYNWWEVSRFYHYPLANVILTLNQIQLEANVICNTILTTNLLQDTTTLLDTIN